MKSIRKYLIVSSCYGIPGTNFRISQCPAQGDDPSNDPRTKIDRGPRRRAGSIFGRSENPHANDKSDHDNSKIKEPQLVSDCHVMKITNKTFSLCRTNEPIFLKKITPASLLIFLFP